MSYPCFSTIQLDRAGMLDVDHVLGAFERQRAPAIHIEVRLQLPMAGIVEEIEPGGHGLDAGRVQAVARVGDVLPVHGGVPQPVPEGSGVHGAFAAEIQIHERHGEELVLDGAYGVVGGLRR